ncbi:beta-ketoacyl synthase N-terminal-like domain-containing protein [Streptomyces sp. NPDC079167]|uniref:beta-ketoacyl-[acyl-carrier-protein] synthase family protein n=1 Tax=Streptomyces sp. NPDC079167 TaxID=3154513 RepID=UPI00342F20CA
MTAEVFVSGFGVFGAFGFGPDALLAGAFAGTPAFRPVTRFDVSHCRTDRAATWQDADAYFLDGRHDTGTVEVASACGRQALDMAGLRGPADVPLVLATKVRAPSLEPDSAAGTTARVADRLGLGTPRRTFVNACCAATNALIHGAQLVGTGAAEAVLAGGAFLVDRQAFGLFDAAQALAADGRLRPFDQDRKGVLLGDGAAMLLLESGKRLRARGAEPLARLAGWAMTDDAFHVAKPHVEGAGAAAAVTGALRRGGIGPDRLTYVNAHATGTPLNDAAEAAGLHTALGDHTETVYVSGTKSTTGHALEASGALEAVISLLAIRSSVLPPTAGLDRPDTRHPLRHVTSPERIDVPYALSLNSSVGGVNAAILLAAA